MIFLDLTSLAPQRKSLYCLDTNETDPESWEAHLASG